LTWYGLTPTTARKHGGKAVTGLGTIWCRKRLLVKPKSYRIDHVLEMHRRKEERSVYVKRRKKRLCEKKKRLCDRRNNRKKKKKKNHIRGVAEWR